MAISWAASADKHGVPHEDALHAIEHAVYVEVEFDEPRLGGRCVRRYSSGRREHLAGRCWR